jgi:hypothetical protein
VKSYDLSDIGGVLVVDALEDENASNDLSDLGGIQISKPDDLSDLGGKLVKPPAGFTEKITPKRTKFWIAGGDISPMGRRPSELPISRFIPKTVESWKRGWRQMDIDFLYNDVIDGKITEEQADKAFADFERIEKENPIEAKNFASKIWYATARMLPGMTRGYYEGAKYGLVGAGMALAAGQAGPQVLAPEEAITVPGSYVIGQGVGSLYYWSKQGRGAIYREARRQGVKPETAALVASIGGPIYGAIEFSQVSKIVPGVNLIKGRIPKIILGILLRTGHESLEEGEQQIIQDLSQSVGKLIDKKIDVADIPDELKKAAKNSWQATYQSLGPMALLQIPGGVVSMAGAEKATETEQAKQIPSKEDLIRQEEFNQAAERTNTEIDQQEEAFERAMAELEGEEASHQEAIRQERTKTIQELAKPTAPLRREFTAEEKTNISAQAKARLNVIELKSTGQKANKEAGLPSQPAQYLTLEEKAERDFLRQNADNPDAIIDAYQIPKPKTHFQKGIDELQAQMEREKQTPEEIQRLRKLAEEPVMPQIAKTPSQLPQVEVEGPTVTAGEAKRPIKGVVDLLGQPVVEAAPRQKQLGLGLEFKPGEAQDVEITQELASFVDKWVHETEETVDAIGKKTIRYVNSPDVDEIYNGIVDSGEKMTKLFKKETNPSLQVATALRQATLGRTFEKTVQIPAPPAGFTEDVTPSPIVSETETGMGGDTQWPEPLRIMWNRMKRPDRKAYAQAYAAWQVGGMKGKPPNAEQWVLANHEAAGIRSKVKLAIELGRRKDTMTPEQVKDRADRIRYRKKLIEETSAAIQGHDLYQSNEESRKERMGDIGPGFYYVSPDLATEVFDVIGRPKVGRGTRLQQMFTTDPAAGAKPIDEALQSAKLRYTEGSEMGREGFDIGPGEFAQAVKEAVEGSAGEKVNERSLREAESGDPYLRMLGAKLEMLRSGETADTIDEALTRIGDELGLEPDVYEDLLIGEESAAMKQIRQAPTEAEKEMIIDKLARQKVERQNRFEGHQAAAEILEANKIADDVEIKDVEGITEEGLPVKPEDDIPFETRGVRTGAYLGRAGQEVILLAYGADSETGYHEGYHALRDRLTANDKKVLDAKYEGDTEREASEFAEFAADRAEAPSNYIRHIWKKLIEILTRIKNALAGRGYKTAEDIFEGIRTGTAPLVSQGKTGKGAVARPPQFETKKGPVFYSKLRRLVEERMPNAMDAEAFRSFVKKMGVKDEEMEWSGVNDLLDWPNTLTGQWNKAGGKPVTVKKKQVLDTIAANSIEIQEVEKSEERWKRTKTEEGTYSKEEQPTKFESYQLPGGENYRELLLQLPGKYTLEGEEKFQYKSTHWIEGNVLAHIRFNDRTDAEGKKVLFIEEIQSDWHQAGRKQGYQQKAKPYLYDDGKYWGIKHPDGTLVGHYETKEAAQKVIDERVDTMGFVPDAPFKKTWQELAFKRMLRYAAENGYDKIAWTTGEQQAERYDLSKQVKEIEWWNQTKDNISLRVRGLDGNIIIAREDIKPQEAENIIGKDITNKILKDISNHIHDGSYSGQDLKVGGEGMKGFYDKILPEFANKYAKQWGGRVGETIVPDTDEGAEGYVVFGPNNTVMGQYPTRAEAKIVEEKYGEGYWIEEVQKNDLRVHSLDITPSMRESVMAGQPQFEHKSADQWRREGIKRAEIEAAKARLRAKAGMKSVNRGRMKAVIRDVTPLITTEFSPQETEAVKGLPITGRKPLTTKIKDVTPWVSEEWQPEPKLAAKPEGPEGAPMPEAAHLGPRNRRGPVVTDKELTEEIYKANRARRESIVRLGLSIENLGGTIAKEARLTFKSIDRVLRDVNLAIKRIMVDMEQRWKQREGQHMEEIRPFMKTTRKMKRGDWKDYDLALKSGDRTKIEVMQAKYPALVEADAKWRQVADDIIELERQVGLEEDYREWYYNRRVRDLPGLKKWINDQYGESGIMTIFEAALQRRKENAGGRKLTPEEEATVLNNTLRGFVGRRVWLSKPGSTKERTLFAFDENINRFYYDSRQAMVMRIADAHAAIASREFFGRETLELQNLRAEKSRLATRLYKATTRIGDKKVDEGDIKKEHLSKARIRFEEISKRIEEFKNQSIESSAGNLANELVMKRKIRPEDEYKLQSALEAYFQPARASHSLHFVRSTAYTTHIGNFLSAMTNLMDYGWILYRAPYHTLSATLRATIPGLKSRYTMDELGLNEMAYDMDKFGMIQKWVFRGAGWKLLDIKMKNILADAVYSDFMSKARKAKNLKSGTDFMDRLQEFFGDDTKGVIEDLQSGLKTEQTTKLVFDEVTRKHPLLRSAMTERYLRSNWARYGYILKNFGLRDAQYLLDEAFKDFGKHPARSVKRILWMAFTLTAADVGVRVLRDLFRGRKIELDKAVADAWLNRLFLSRYNINIMRREGLGKGITEAIYPPTPVEISVRQIPLVGEPYYNWFGEGRRKELEKQEKESKKNQGM